MSHRIYVEEILTPFYFDEGEEHNLLDCLEKQGVEMQSHCRAGFCGTCRVPLLEGEVHYPGGPPLAYIREGEILPCCCVPVSDLEIKASCLQPRRNSPPKQS